MIHLVAAHADLPRRRSQWQHGPGGPRLAVVSDTALPDVPLTGELTPAW
ncbi:hypothetical protein [Streptomyces sp. DH10]|nr:hypothetical protein [Streptomyces sp. DH10]MDG9708741.1 hypothetical protein [Streptomyces sp. DH10]